MLTLFRYNWQVRDDWFDWCEGVPDEELIRQRIGGVGSFLRTLWHIVDSEYSWIRATVGKSDVQLPFEDYQTLRQVRALSYTCRPELRFVLEKWTPDMDSNKVHAPWRPGEAFSGGHVLRHVIAHEIHHMGQLSIWARDLGREPVSANLVDRNLG